MPRKSANTHQDVLRVLAAHTGRHDMDIRKVREAFLQLFNQVRELRNGVRKGHRPVVGDTRIDLPRGNLERELTAISEPSTENGPRRAERGEKVMLEWAG